MSQEINATMNEYLPLRDVVFQTLRQASWNRANV